MEDSLVRHLTCQCQVLSVHPSRQDKTHSWVPVVSYQLENLIKVEKQTIYVEYHFYIYFKIFFSHKFFIENNT